MHTVAVVAFDDISVFEMAVACEVFGIDRSDMGLPNYRLIVCGLEPGPLRTKAGFTMRPAKSLRALERADTIIVPAWRDVEEPPPARLLSSLRRAHARGARIASLCSGAFVLAAAGLLDGRRATTHWMYAAKLAERYPKVLLDPAVLYVEDGNVYTSAGTAAGIDLCLHLVRNDHGAEVANMFARRMVVAPHRDGGQAQYLQRPMRVDADDDAIARTMEWALGHLEDPLTVEDLAHRAGLPPRTYARRFRSSTGTTPYAWLLHQRVLLAQRLLETTDHSVERIAQECGFGSPATLRFHFERAVRVPPLLYRRAFRRTHPPAFRAAS
jgi:transcriptional regulator GlxA family with amidase domain